MAGNTINVQGSYIDVHDNEVVNLSVDKAQVNLQQEVKEHDGREHFSMTVDTIKLNNLLQCLIKEGWVESNTTDGEWRYRLTGHGEPTSNPIVFTSPTQCHYIVKNFIFKNKRLSKADWDLVMKLFRTTNGKITNVRTSTKTPSGSNIIDEYL